MAGKQQHQPEEQCGVKLDQAQFCCSICLELLKDPVTIHCGHNYCKMCIESYWDQREEKGEFSCPQCRETFSPRPLLKRNNTLSEVVEKLRTQQREMPAPPAAAVACVGPDDVTCDFCSGTKPNKATMSCLTCLASYCPAHLEPHCTVPVLKKHQLVSATVPLQEKMCTKHNKLTEIYCVTDQQLVCSLCAVEEHKGHETNPVSVLKAMMEKYLVRSQRKIQKTVQQREKELQELSQAEDSLKSCALTALKDSDQIFGELIASMQRRRSEVKQLIRDQEKTAVAQAEELRLRLLEEITKLWRRNVELNELSHADDHILLIKVTFLSLSTSCDCRGLSPGAGPLRSFTEVTDCLSDLRDKLEIVLSDAWPRISATVSYVEFSVLPAPTTRQEFLRYCCPLTLDVTTNYPYLHPIADNLRVRPTASPYSAQPDRFSKFAQVLCKEGLSERCYWEVEWHARTLSAAVAYSDIDRTSDESQFGSNDKSWSLECGPHGYTFRHNNVETNVPGPGSSKIGVYLDYKVGTLCFYHVSDEVMVLLHRVQTTFIQPLYPGLGLNYEWYDAGVFAQLVKLWE
ncbi:E3 ubiquitin-protein ligase TRIM47-like [Pempheris klunzingeri]|uniref:E3 ubiquitin-protein ligase TRIM47-like n=1 Tax=Pempheris klunzingeri TaxID=3127111 RepID=UPI00397FA771